MRGVSPGKEPESQVRPGGWPQRLGRGGWEARGLQQTTLDAGLGLLLGSQRSQLRSWELIGAACRLNRYLPTEKSRTVRHPLSIVRLHLGGL